MKVQRGVQAEFTSLGDWMREKTLFELLVCIKYFKHYTVGCGPHALFAWLYRLPRPASSWFMSAASQASQG